MTDDLTRFLAKPEPTAVTPLGEPLAASSYINVTEQRVDGELVLAPGALANEGTALRFLEAEGLTAEEWEATHFRRIEYAGNTSVKFSFKRVAHLHPNRVPIDELLAIVNASEPRAPREPGVSGDHGFGVDMGDNQYGKIDGDGVDGALKRTLLHIDMAREELDRQRKLWDIGPVVIAALGDHMEGFVSQGGANTWRTGLTVSEQQRLVRRTFLYIVERFKDEELHFLAVPGNHDQPVRIQGKGVTRYDDSHDTEALLAVADACSMNPDAYGHIKFYVPQTDEIAVTLDLADTRQSFVHGHHHRPGQHWKWWEGQAFGRSPLATSDILHEGHLHHGVYEERGRRAYMVTPAQEAESTWFRHATGVPGFPGLTSYVFGNGQIKSHRMIRA